MTPTTNKKAAPGKGAAYQPRAHYTSNESIEQALSFIPPHDHDIWIKGGMALKSEFGDAGFDGMGQVGCLP